MFEQKLRGTIHWGQSSRIDPIYPVVPLEPIEVNPAFFPDGIPGWPATGHRVVVTMAIIKQAGFLVRVLRAEAEGQAGKGGAGG